MGLAGYCRGDGALVVENKLVFDIKRLRLRRGKWAGFFFESFKAVFAVSADAFCRGLFKAGSMCWGRK